MKPWPFPAASEQVPAFRARGINPTSTILSNKLLAMIDGRSFYTPQADTVNGVLNIVTQVAVFGRNLPEECHVKTRHGFNLPQKDVPRSVYARVAWRM